MEDKPEDLNEEAKANVEALGRILFKIRNRLISEGYTITKDGIIERKSKVLHTRLGDSKEK